MTKRSMFVGLDVHTAERLAHIARSAATEAEAVEAIRLALEDILK